MAFNTSLPPALETPPPVIEPARDPAAVLDQLAPRIRKLQEEVGKVIIGQEEIVSAALYALFARGHCLLVGVPGLAKTLLVHALARSLELTFSRIQFTPDLMPSDITGTEILEEDAATGHRRFVFARGPAFTQVLLADEINRTPPKTQAALLEAMQEKTVTVAGKVYRLEEPFMVLATQNPIEQEGTYPLPEAQLDRFLFELLVDYPTLGAGEARGGAAFLCAAGSHPAGPDAAGGAAVPERHRPGAGCAERHRLRRAPGARHPAQARKRASASDYIKRWMRWGASPRASQHLILAGRARAACQGRFNVACEDVAALAPLVLRHRLIRTFQADAEGKTTDDIIAQVAAGCAEGPS